jgi:hypothetical protein
MTRIKTLILLAAKIGRKQNVNNVLTNLRPDAINQTEKEGRVYIWAGDNVPICQAFLEDWDDSA